MLNTNKRILIISNNAMSYTSNNGKTIMSLFEEYPKDNIAQLYTRNELPSVSAYGYFRITESDILKGIIDKKKRGHCVELVSSSKQELVYKANSYKGKRTALKCLLRELIWLVGWKSEHFENWIRKYNPDVIFFVAGDTMFSYRLCNYVAKISNAEICVYVTDDYIIKRSKESIFDVIKRRLVYKYLKDVVSRSKSFFTISEKMRMEYKHLLNKDSMPVFNISKELRMNDIKPQSDKLVFLYAGSLYYGRENVINKIADSILDINKTYYTNAVLEIYSNQEPAENVLKLINIDGASYYKGSLSKDELQIKMNQANVLVFVESFDQIQKEKTRLSLSTKISEYLSIGRPILAIGPNDIGSMEFISDSAICVNEIELLHDALHQIITDKSIRESYGQLALNKFNTKCDYHALRDNFIRSLCE